MTEGITFERESSPSYHLLPLLHDEHQRTVYSLRVLAVDLQQSCVPLPD